MPCSIPRSLGFAALVCTFAALAALGAAVACVAENDGQGDLDRATEVKLNARTLSDLDEVVRLLQSALEKGLDEGNTQFAEALLAATLVQRGTVRAQIAQRTALRDAQFDNFRRAALDDLERAIAIDPNQPEAYLVIAELQRLPNGDLKRARRAVDEAVRLSANQPDLKARALTLRALLAEKAEDKLADLNEAVRLAPGDAQAVRARGLVLADMGKLEEGVADLDRAIELAPEHLPTYEAKALLLSRLQRFDEALECLEQAARATSESIPLLVGRARIHMLQSDLDAALADLEKARQMEPHNVAVLLLRAAIQPDPEKKLADLDEAVKLAPENAAVWRARAALLAELKRSDDALKDCEKALALDPTHEPTWYLKALLLADAQRKAEARATLDKALELLPQSAALLLARARLLIELDDHEGALKDLDRAHAVEADSAEVLLLRAVVHQQLDHADQALADIRRALKLAPESAAVRRVHGLILAQAGQMTEALAEMEKAHQLDPDDTPTMLQLAMLYMAKDNYARAIEMFTAVLQKEPENADALHGRGDALLNMGKQAEAIADYEKALKLDADDPGVLNNLAWVLATSPDAKLRDGRRAIELATKACELTEYKRPHILSTLGAAYAETGDFESARKWCEKGLELADDEETKASLQKEHARYEARKPVRELLTDGKPVEVEEQPPEDKPAEAQPREEKPAEAQPPQKKPAEGQSPDEKPADGQPRQEKPAEEQS